MQLTYFLLNMIKSDSELLNMKMVRNLNSFNYYSSYLIKE